MARPLTIDNYDVVIHERWAKDQEELERVYFQDTNQIPAHLDIAALEKSLLSKWEELFELDMQRHAFAHFAPPPRYAIMRNRFFSFVISPEFDWAEEMEDEDEEEQKKEEQHQAELFRKKIKSKKAKGMHEALFAKEQGNLLNLIDSIQMLNGFLREIYARKLQYQKG